MIKLKKSDISQNFSKSVARSSVFTRVKWGESYTSLFLGIVVVVVAAILVFSFLKSKNFNLTSTQSTSTSQEQLNTSLPKTYNVKEGDDLWSVSEKIYGSGYNWVDLASANKLENPGILYVGTKLTIPNVSPRIVKSNVNSVNKTQSANSITGSTYTVQKGDYLWEIAVRAYGDGYKWVEIARTNKLVNPDLIYSGNVLKLPR